jgi:nicotinate phosphoribosyltransferase
MPNQPGHSALLTDLYQVTMAQAYFSSGLHQRQAVFHLYFRSLPFNGGYAIAAGLEQAIAFLQHFAFSEDDVDYLRSLNGNDDKPLFTRDFLQHLTEMRWQCSLAAVPEGTAVFAHEPLVRVTGPILQCQLIETALLNIINFQTLVATKAARICQSANGKPVMEFGLRRAQGPDGGLSASRAAYIGGCQSTSNVLAGSMYGIPVSGTHAHSWVMAFEQEIDAFRAFARTMPNNAVLLVDTYDTLEGIKTAIVVGHELREKGQQLAGIRLDSGDLAYFSRRARQMLDEAGLHETKIVASNDLDEHIIQSLEAQNAAIDLLGVGTKLATAYDQPALGGVYKLSAIQDESGQWQNRIKLSEQTVKINNPGIQQVTRFVKEGVFAADAIHDQRTPLHGQVTIVDPADSLRRKQLNTEDYELSQLLVPVYDDGRCVYESPALSAIQARSKQQLSMLDASVKRLVNPHIYIVGMERSLFDEKTRLIMQLRNG